MCPNVYKVSKIFQKRPNEPFIAFLKPSSIYLLFIVLDYMILYIKSYLPENVMEFGSVFI